MFKVKYHRQETKVHNSIKLALLEDKLPVKNRKKNQRALKHAAIHGATYKFPPV